MKLEHPCTFAGILLVLQFVSVTSTLSDKNQHQSKQFTLSCTGMDYSFRKQRMLENNDEVTMETFKGLYPEGQEVLYSYSTVVTTGTKFPAQYVSQFNMSGMIKVQGLKDKARVQFLNLKFVMYSGDFLGEKKLKANKLPEQVSTIYEPFDIYYREGQVLKLEVTSETPMWSRSIKQAISGILQLDLRKINTEHYSSFVSSEKCIHGDCAVLYSVKPEDNKVHITKFYSPENCKQKSAGWSNVEHAPGCMDEHAPGCAHIKNLKSYSHKTYRVTPYGTDTLLIREVLSEGKTYRFVKENSNSTHYVTVSQKLQLVSMNGITRIHEITNPEAISTLEFDVSQFYSFKFTTNEDLNKVVTRVYALLSAVRSELEEKNSLLSDQINPQESHLVPLLITYLRKLDLPMLQQFFTALETKNDKSSTELFKKIVLLVGSKDVALFIVSLIKHEKVKNVSAELLVSSLPFQTRQVLEEHLVEFEDLLHLPESATNALRNTAVLSFATLVYRTCKAVRCQPETIDKYMLHYIEKSNEYSEQLVYVAGLCNLHVQNIEDILVPMLSGQEPVSSESIRVMALRAILPAVVGNPDKAYNIYWPVVMNRGNSLELRASALVLLTEAQQEPSIYMQLHHAMNTDDTGGHLYNIYYKLMKLYSEENETCYLTRTKIAQEVIKSMRKPLIAKHISSYYTFSIPNGKINMLTVFNPLLQDGISVYVTYSSKYNNIPIIYNSVYLKLTGVNEELMNQLLLTISDIYKLKERLDQLVQDKLIPENFQLLFILYSQQQVISLRSYDENTIYNFVEDMKNMVENCESFENLSFLHATSFFNSETFFVTDIGFPGVLSLDFPKLLSFHSHVTSDNSKSNVNMNASFDFRLWSQGSTVLKVKNTFVDVWQGIMNSHTSHFNLPLNLVVDFGNQVKLLLKSTTNEENNHIGFKWQTQTDIFTVTNSEGYDALAISCEKCHLVSTVKNRKSQIAESEIQDKGYRLHNKLFDCEDDGTINLLKSALNFNSPNTIHALGTMFSAGFFLETHLLGQPVSGSCGYSTVYTPNPGCIVRIDLKQHTNNITLLIGGTEVTDEGNAPDSVIVSVALDGSREEYHDEEELKGECKRKLAAGFEAKLKEQFKGKVDSCGVGKSNGYAENLDWCEKEMKPQIMGCIQSEMVKKNVGNIVKLSVKTNELPKDIEQSLNLFVSDFLETHKGNSFEVEEDKTSDKSETIISINFGKSKYTLNLHTPDKSVIVTDTLC